MKRTTDLKRMSDVDLKDLEAELWKSRPKKKWRCAQPIDEYWPDRRRWLGVIGEFAARGLPTPNGGLPTPNGGLRKEAAL